MGVPYERYIETILKTHVEWVLAPSLRDALEERPVEPTVQRTEDVHVPRDTPHDTKWRYTTDRPVHKEILKAMPFRSLMSAMQVRDMLRPQWPTLTNEIVLQSFGYYVRAGDVERVGRRYQRVKVLA